MNKKHLLWFLVAANVVFAFASVGAEGFFGWTLPPALAEYTHERFTGISHGGMLEALRLMVLAATALFAFAAWIGLATFWRHARGLFVLSLGLDLLFRFVAGPSVTTSVGEVFRMMDCIVSGSIIGLVYFSDLARVFERRPIAEGGAALGMGADRA
jgi:hypothetical protein